MRWWVKTVKVRQEGDVRGVRPMQELTFDAEDYAWVDETGLHFKSCEGEKTHIPMHRIEMWTTEEDS